MQSQFTPRPVSRAGGFATNTASRSQGQPVLKQPSPNQPVLKSGGASNTSYGGYDESNSGQPPARQKQPNYYGFSPFSETYNPTEHYYDNQLAGRTADAYSNLGSAGMGAMGQYGSAVAGSLANQSIAAGNTFGQMANAYYNTMGQLGQVGSALAAAGLTAGAGSASGTMGGGMSFGGGGGSGGAYGGFDVSGPGGSVASGTMDSSPWSTNPMSAGSNYGASVQKGATPGERFGMTGQGFNFLDSIRSDLRGGQGGMLAGLANNQFNANREATMNPMFMDSMNSMFKDSAAGIGGQSKTPETDERNGIDGYYALNGTTSYWAGKGQPNKKAYNYSYIPPQYMDPSSMPNQFPADRQIRSGW